jgi:putative zinc finger/helix-turn-helix YgiT family protein
MMTMTEANSSRDQRTEPCLVCEEAQATLSYEDQEFNYGLVANGVVLHARVPVWTCQGCGEQYLDGAAEDIKHEAVCAYLGRLTPREIKDLRVSFEMRQEEFAGFTGYGIASIKRWESAAQIQSESVDRYLRLLRSLGVAEVAKRSTPPKIPEFRTEFSPEIRERAKTFHLRVACPEPQRMAA